MGNGLYIAAAGASARQRHLDVVSDNLANVSTDGYREARVSFENVLQGAGETKVSKSSGSPRHTGRKLDAFLSGEGFFAVQAENGDKLFTRLGSFAVDSKGNLVTREGMKVLGETGPITGIKAQPSIAADGSVYSGKARVGQLRVVGFEDVPSLQRRGGLTFATDQTPKNLSTRIIPETVEGSNVNAVRAMTDLVRVHRSFETSTRAIETYRQMDRRLTDDVGSP